MQKSKFKIGDKVLWKNDASITYEVIHITSQDEVVVLWKQPNKPNNSVSIREADEFIKAPVEKAAFLLVTSREEWARPSVSAAFDTKEKALEQVYHNLTRSKKAILKIIETDGKVSKVEIENLP